MKYDFYYGPEAEQFSFYRIPKVLFEAESVKNISTDAKLLYGLMLDRMQLSAKNKWYDENGRIYIYYTLKQIMKSLGCAKQKAVKLLDELERDAELIERERIGLNKPNRIFVKNFLSVYTRKYENQTSGSMKIKPQEVRKSYPSNTNNINTDFSDIEYIESIMDDDEKDEYLSYKEYLLEKIEYEYLVRDHPYKRDVIDEMVELMLEVLCSNQNKIRICGDDKPIALVKSRFMKLDSGHITYVLECMSENTVKVRNIKAYLLSSLYNAPLTIGNYYAAQVNNERANVLI